MDFCGEARVFKEHLALVERADAFRHLPCWQIRARITAGREYSKGAGARARKWLVTTAGAKNAHAEDERAGPSFVRQADVEVTAFVS